MSAVLDVVAKEKQDIQGPPDPGKKRVGWPKGVPRGPRKPKPAVAAEQAQPVARRARRKNKVDRSAGEIGDKWVAYQREFLKRDGSAEIEARKAYHSGAFDVLMLLGNCVPEGLPPSFMKWVQQCQKGMLGKD